MNLANEIHRIATEYNLPLAQVANAVKRLGHINGNLIAEYLRQKDFAIVRKVPDGNGGFRTQTPEEFADRFKTPPGKK